MLSAAFYTLGCKVNQYESYALMAAFEAEGFVIVSPEQPADVYIVNSCTVTATGDKKSLQALRRFRRQSPGAVTVLCGCYPQAFPDRAEVIPEADIIIGSKKKSAVVNTVMSYLAEERGSRRVEILPHTTGDPFEIMSAPLFPDRTRAYLKIQDGCERRCSYCIIPEARGPVRSKPIDALKEELRGIAAAGYQEVVLVGINLSCYGSDIGHSLTDAIALAQETQGIERIRLGSLEPERLDRDAIITWTVFSKLCPQFHLSLQSGCDRTLRNMRRQYDTRTYANMVDSLRNEFPSCAITTDIMVAFPGETAEEHAMSEAFLRDMEFARTHVFAYSPRPGTPAAKMTEQVPPEEGKRRAIIMEKAAKEAERAFLKRQVGTVQNVLFEKKSGGLWQGYTQNYTMVKAPSIVDVSGKILPVLLNTAHDIYCTGEIMGG